jgi:hypothetical protein
MTWADYNPAPYAASDEDGAQADIHFSASLDRGVTWSVPSAINRDVGHADQFQPYIRATESGQLNAFFFDRRFDRPDPPGHPGNFFIDNFLARSNDRADVGRDPALARLLGPVHQSADLAVG